ncbi:MAG: hypothetical protein U1E28_01050 [Beijerinckiaceae bacterium]
MKRTKTLEYFQHRLFKLEMQTSEMRDLVNSWERDAKVVICDAVVAAALETSIGAADLADVLRTNVKSPHEKKLIKITLKMLDAKANGKELSLYEACQD